MKILAELTEKSLGLSNKSENLGGIYKLRKSARGIILNKKGEMAVQHIQKYDFYKLPGGGAENGETIKQTLLREIREEVGCDLKIIQPVGVVIEYHEEFLHISYCFVAEVVGDIHEPKFEEDEIENNQKTVWMPPKIFLETLQNDLVRKEKGDYILHREMTFVTEFLKL